MMALEGGSLATHRPDTIAPGNGHRLHHVQDALGMLKQGAKNKD